MKRKAFASALISSLVFSLGVAALAQQKKIKTGLTPEDWAYKLAEGVTSKEVTYFSDGIACWAKIFYPKGFAPTGKTPGIVLGQGWAGSHFSIEKYGARFAERGLVAMAIDYRGWGSSDGFISQSQPSVSRGDREPTRDDKRFTSMKADVVIKRTRLIPMKQVEDFRNAISYLQGEPGVDPNRIGIWGSSFAGGNVIVVAALDSRVKAVVGQVPAIGGKNSPAGPVPLTGKLLEDAIKRARTGQGAEFETGFSTRRMVDIETQQMVAEYRPFHYLKSVGDRPVLLIPAEKEELINNRDNAYAALEVLTGPKKLIEVPGITHFEMYIGEAFEISSNAAANWFRQYLGMEAKAETAQTGKENEPNEGYMTATDGVKIHYYVKGKGTPVILIHGYTGSAAGNWLANGIFDALARNHMVVALDCRNHGKSDKPQINGPGKAEDVVELMDHLKIKRAHFHGYSMGGGIVGRLLAMIPDRMITAGFGGSGIPEVDPDWKAKVPADKEGRDPQEAEVSKRLRIRHAMDNGMSREEAEKLAETPPAPRPAPSAAATPRPAGPQLDLTRLNIPMIAINGEFDRPNAKTTRMAREVKNFTNVILPGKSHLTAISSGYIPKEYIESLVKFIDANDPKM